MDDTIVYEHDSHAPEQPGRPRPPGSPDMPTPSTSPAGQNRYTYSSGARPLDGYTIKRAIGRGGFGEVYYATSDSGKEVALKLILRNLDVERRGVVQCMNLKCPNLLQVYDLRGTDSGETFVIMEYVAGPSLANVLARYRQGMPEAEVRAWLKGLVEGVAYLHDHGVVHRDLKPANLFMEEGIVKIGDYGLAKLITPSQGTEHSESIGTCHYMAPEIASGKYHKPIDVYATGIILYEMLTGRVPFEGETVGEILMKHLTARPDLAPLREPYRSIVAKALAKDPNLRPSRVYDLLPPDDAPREAAVRFIGAGKAAPAAPKKDDGVFRIEAEDSVFYIGPDTKPPRPAPTLNQRLRAAWQGPHPAPAPRTAPPRRPAPPTAAQRLASIRRQALAPTAPQPPPTQPPLPSARVRVAELASSLLWAAPAAALLVVPLAAAMGVEPSQPERVAFLFGMSLLGAWGALVPAKLFEGRAVDPAVRRGAALAAGAAAGLLGGAFGSWVQLGLWPGWVVDPRVTYLVGWPFPSLPLTFGVYFAALGLLGGWPSLAARDRPRRFRVFPVVKAGAVAGLLGLLWPFPEPWGIGIAAATAAVVQAVSPWSEPAAAYARYAAKAARSGRKVA